MDGMLAMTSRHRTAATLFEVILVMTILVVAAALVFPSLQSLQAPYKLDGAVDSVRGAWAEARARAIEEGRPYRFAVEPDGVHYRVAPDQDSYWAGAETSEDPKGAGLVLEHSLPTGVRFSVNGEQASASPPPQEDGQDNYGQNEKETSVSVGSWTTAAVFLPDGTARDDAEVLFQVRGTRAKSLHLSSMTGNVTVKTH